MPTCIKPCFVSHLHNLPSKAPSVSGAFMGIVMETRLLLDAPTAGLGSSFISEPFTTHLSVFLFPKVKAIVPIPILFALIGS